MMATSVYTINKGINKPIEFRGLKGQYIWYLAAGLLILLVLFALLYICGLSPYLCLLLVLLLGTALFVYVYRLSHLYGQYGLMKKRARKYLPTAVKSYSRNPFLCLTKIKSHGTQPK